MNMKPLNSTPQELQVPNPEVPSSAAAVVVAQARTKAKSGRNGIESFVQARAEFGVNLAPRDATLNAVFPGNAGGESHQISLSFLLGFPGLQPMFTAAFVRWGATRSPQSRKAMRENLRTGLFRYLEAHWNGTIEPHDIDDELLAAFRSSLQRENGKLGKPLHPRTVASYLGSVRSVLDALDHGVWAGVARAIAVRVPQGPIGAVRKVTPTEVLKLDDLLAILEASEREVLAMQERFLRGKALLSSGRTRLPDPDQLSTGKRRVRGPYHNLDVCLAALDATYPGVVPDLDVIVTANPALARKVKDVHGYGTVTSYLYPSSRDLVPFVLLLTILTIFNPDTVLGLDWNDIDFDKEHAGMPAILIVGEKNRATKDLARLLDPEAPASSQLSLKQLLILLRETTERIRPCVLKGHADRLFVFVQETAGKPAKGYGSVGSKHRAMSGDGAWARSLLRFIRDNKLPSFTLGQLRPTILELVQFTHGTLEAARSVGNHHSPATTWTHYVDLQRNMIII
jgi:hypothetical protein